MGVGVGQNFIRTKLIKMFKVRSLKIQEEPKKGIYEMIYLEIYIFFSPSILFPERCNTETGFDLFPILQLCVDSFEGLFS